MNLGSNILQLRKKRNITQEELACELGVTAAAVSKWEKGYTLPDILMLCALADFFCVTTDDLLGRNPTPKYAIIAAETPEQGKKIQTLAKKYGIIGKKIVSTYPDALAAAKADSAITHLLIGLNAPLSEEENNASGDLTLVNIQVDDEQKLLEGFELYFKHIMPRMTDGTGSNRN